MSGNERIDPPKPILAGLILCVAVLLGGSLVDDGMDYGRLAALVCIVAFALTAACIGYVVGVTKGRDQ